MGFLSEFHCWDFINNGDGCISFHIGFNMCYNRLLVMVDFHVWCDDGYSISILGVNFKLDGNKLDQFPM